MAPDLKREQRVVRIRRPVYYIDFRLKSQALFWKKPAFCCIFLRFPVKSGVHNKKLKI